VLRTNGYRNHSVRKRASTLLIVSILLLGPNTSFAQELEPSLRFDVATFCCPCTLSDHFCDAQFEALNWVSANGHYLAMGTDWRRNDVEDNGNRLAFYSNTLNSGWTQMTGEEKADQIWNLASLNFPGGVPQYFILNEISAGLWPTNPAYRAWVHDVVHTLKNTYGVDPIVASPFQNPGRNDTDWQAVSEDAYIAIETYLSGLEIKNAEFSLEWCETQYQKSKQSYLNRGVPESRLILIEHFGQTTDASGWGRAGVSNEEWDYAIIIRSMAAKTVGFTGFLSYAWGKNAMEVSDEELIHFEETYRALPLP